MAEIECWKFEFFVKSEEVFAYEEVFEEFADAVMSSDVEEGEYKDFWKMEILYYEKPEKSAFDTLLKTASDRVKKDVPNYEIIPIEAKNWLLESLDSFKPVTINRFYIYGSHIKENPPTDLVALQIDAATAFGSGEHPTTSGCLENMDDLEVQGYVPENILDMGCGSGILAMAAVKIWQKPVLGVDIDEESVRVANENAKVNEVDQHFKAYCGDGYNLPLVGEKSPYDLVLANILAGPLCDMAPSLAENLKTGGYAILSGLLIEQEDWVIEAHEKAGLKLLKATHIGEWSTLLMEKE